MKEHFKEQLPTRTPITADDIKVLKGHPLYHNTYEPGDKMVVFMDQTEETCFMIICVERDFDQMEKDYEFIRMSTFNVPVLKKLDRLSTDTGTAVSMDNVGCSALKGKY